MDICRFHSERKKKELRSIILKKTIYYQSLYETLKTNCISSYCLSCYFAVFKGYKYDYPYLPCYFVQDSVYIRVYNIFDLPLD